MSFWSKMERCADLNLGDPVGLQMDLEDMDRFGNHRLYLNAKGYVVVEIDGYSRLLARLIMGEPAGQHVHHINGDKLDNRRANLQVLPPSTHMRDHAKSRRVLKSRQWAQEIVARKIEASRDNG